MCVNLTPRGLLVNRPLPVHSATSVCCVDKLDGVFMLSLLLIVHLGLDPGGISFQLPQLGRD